jgi:hypothetical protein
VRVRALSPYAVELEFPEANGRLVFELHVCGNFVVREYVGGELEAEYHLPTTYRFDIQAGKVVAGFARRLGLDPRAVLEELRGRAGELPALFLDRPLLQILKMFSRIVAQVPEAAPEDPLQLLRNATEAGLSIETLRESVKFRYNLEEGRWEPAEVECKGRSFPLEEFRKLIGGALAGLSSLPEGEPVEARCPVCGKRGRVEAGRLRRHLEGHLSRVEEAVEELLSDRGFLDRERDVEIALRVAELEEEYGLSVDVDEANELEPGYYAFKVLVEGSGGWSFLEGSLEECLSDLESILERVAGDRVTCPFCGRSYLRVDAAERGECECGAAIVVGRSARSTDTYLSDALDRLIEMAAEDTPLLEAEEDALAVLAEHFRIHKLLENVAYAGRGKMGWPMYFVKRPVRLSPAGQLLVNHALHAAALDVEEAEEELAARVGRCGEKLWGLKRRGPCIGALCPLFARCLRRLARGASSLELPARARRKLEKTASRIEGYYEKLLKELEETLREAR